MTDRTLGIILNGATGRICSTQHLANALAPLRAEGGLEIGGEKVMPRLILAGRDEAGLAEIARAHGIDAWTTDLDAALADDNYPVFFDASASHLRLEVLRRALAAGKHVFSEKPFAPSVKDGLELLGMAEAGGLKHGVVEDKLFIPGFRKLSHLMESGFFGRIVGFRLEFGWWVFDGLERPSQRPSWNYQKSGGGGLVFDMHSHWRYIVEGLLGPIARVSCATWTAQPQRNDENGARYDVDVEDSAATLVELENGAFGTILSTWATRVRRDDLMTLHIDGTLGSAVAGLRKCWAQSAADTPTVTGFNLGSDPATLDDHVDYFADWREVPEPAPYKNPFRICWENYIAHVIADAAFTSDFNAGLRDVLLPEACLRSATDGKWSAMTLPERLP